ncbi:MULTISPECIES: carboxymuconolactone decarboxylase family protein [Pseudomonas]|uniref:Carboxymuconolactone decarboxylase family protein n=1 Tax=Ectopseudomonas khazarica TaxID=2502979 RepID=A0ABW7MCH7_9GAMM|nr:MULTISPECIES: carboxymuconolactone decarboxylase family protein [Pseudomonas]QFT21459.1 Alkyl hydroperoxide reductase AhpD [Pseudomonas sp. THAF187a]QFT41647.1 Alkyl hydroperoxide reductase AhpD [Pseudomonas sp. THAF42]TNF09135.1 MAG: carboxymuconolactone decarboxylase family protein [Pseudomonadales bacterium]HIQ43428.1 carboxymuconolactone decarboxylase family protein [Pseudomonas oleovorans]
MTRITALPFEQTAASAQAQLEGIRKGLGFVPNTFATLAHAPAALSGYLALSQALGKGTLDARAREVVALASSQVNGCEYCLAAHTLFGSKAGLSDADIRSARDGELDAVARLTRQVIDHRGRLTDAQLQAARQAGLADAAIVEVVANVALMTLTNYLNNLAETDVDFPPVAV